VGAPQDGEFGIYFVGDGENSKKPLPTLVVTAERKGDAGLVVWNELVGRSEPVAQVGRLTRSLWSVATTRQPCH
jgi:hypothetical protein